MTAGDVIIRVEDVDAGYDGVAILERIRFEVRRGEVFGILGGSGCGKSTLMKNMIGLNPPIAGHVYIDDDDIVTADDLLLETHPAPVRRHVPVRRVVRVDDAARERAAAPRDLHRSFPTTPSISSRG